MGRIGKTTRKGTMECENCHGPGSKHVPPGGGRGVGGMNGFRPGATAAQIEENNGVCLTCHEKGERTCGTAARTKRAGSPAPIATR